MLAVDRTYILRTKTFQTQKNSGKHCLSFCKVYLSLLECTAERTTGQMFFNIEFSFCPACCAEPQRFDCQLDFWLHFLESSIMTYKWFPVTVRSLPIIVACSLNLFANQSCALEVSAQRFSPTLHKTLANGIQLNWSKT